MIPEHNNIINCCILQTIWEYLDSDNIYQQVLEKCTHDMMLHVRLHNKLLHTSLIIIILSKLKVARWRIRIILLNFMGCDQKQLSARLILTFYVWCKLLEIKMNQGIMERAANEPLIDIRYHPAFKIIFLLTCHKTLGSFLPPCPR